MKFFAFVVVLSLTVLATAASAAPSSAASIAADVAKFEKFTKDFGRAYDTAEEFNLRFINFQATLRRNERLNAMEGAIFGINKFADLSMDEFRAQYLGYKPSAANQAIRNATRVRTPAYVASEVPQMVNWTAKGVVSPVKNQMQCGSCWAFSTTEEIESMSAMAGNPLIELSVQQIVSCDTVDSGCNGGDTITAYQYVQQAGGLVLGSQYPYTSGQGVSGSCKNDKLKDKKVTVTGHSYATPGCFGACATQDEKKLMENVASHGPASICVNAEVWNSYTGGILTAAQCGGSTYSDLDHCVQLTGYDALNGYYEVRNSWGADWGVNGGWVHLKIGENTCGVADEATFADIKVV